MANPPTPAEFFSSLSATYKTDAPLRWSFLLFGLTGDRVDPVMAGVGELGFAEAEPGWREDRDGEYTLWLSEVRRHTADSFARRVAQVEEYAAREGLTVADYSAGVE